MSRLALLVSFLSPTRAETRTSAPIRNFETSSSGDLFSIQANESWLQEAPRTSMEIAHRVFDVQKIKEFEMTFYESFPALEEAGYQAIEGTCHGFENLVWVKV